MLLLCGRMGGKWGWKLERSILKGGKTTFSSFSSSYRHIHMKPSLFPPSPSASLSLCTVEFTLAAFARCRGHGLCINAILCSWNFIRMLLMYTAKKKHKSLWKRWQHHPIFSVFMAHFNPHSFFSLLLLILLRMYTFFAASCLFVATRL